MTLNLSSVPKLDSHIRIGNARYGMALLVAGLLLHYNYYISNEIGHGAPLTI